MALTLSIVVPVYNVKQYLGKCVSSLLQQDISKEEYEIILVDDGSTDGSGQLCDEIASKEHNIIVVHQTNQGLSVARNSGTSIAKGKYIQFVDSDDYLQNNVLRELTSIMENNGLDILRFEYKRVTKWGENPKTYIKATSEQVQRVWEGKEFLLHKLGVTCYACQFIIRREILEINHIKFKPGIIFEDTEWTPRLLAVSHKVSSIDSVVYYYLIREGSITNSFSKKKIDGQLNLIDELIIQMGFFEDSRWHQGMISHIAVSVISTISKSLYVQRKEYLTVLKDKGIFPLSSFLASKKGLRKVRLINFSPALACFLIHLFNK